MPTETWEHWVEERVCENEERMDAVSQKLADTAVALDILRNQLERVQQMLDELRQEAKKPRPRTRPMITPDKGDNGGPPSQ